MLETKEPSMKQKSYLIPMTCCVLALIFAVGFGHYALAQTKTPEDKAQSRRQAPAAGARAKADFWFDKAALVATYGNNKAAIRYYQKALSLNPNLGGAYFGQGISYGQLGDYQMAISRINRALQLEPQNGMYYYGRGRVFLMSGDKTKAMEDIRRAAELGDEDALNYLDYIGQR
jgi:tetratricopeptide (TPR) repeat protein